MYSIQKFNKIYVVFQCVDLNFKSKQMLSSVYMCIIQSHYILFNTKNQVINCTYRQYYLRRAFSSFFLKVIHIHAILHKIKVSLVCSYLLQYLNVILESHWQKITHIMLCKAVLDYWLFFIVSCQKELSVGI